MLLDVRDENGFCLAAGGLRFGVGGELGVQVVDVDFVLAVVEGHVVVVEVSIGGGRCGRGARGWGDGDVEFGVGVVCSVISICDFCIVLQCLYPYLYSRDRSVLQIVAHPKRRR